MYLLIVNFKAGETHRFNKATTEKHLRRRVPVGGKMVKPRSSL
ncbi:hypothetical protein [Vibrio phage J14]|nr:hypothetical protein [Vibrio phage J14]